MNNETDDLLFVSVDVVKNILSLDKLADASPKHVADLIDAVYHKLKELELEGK